MKKEGDILKLKKWGEDEETNPMYKIKSLELKRSDQMGSNPIDKNVNRNPEFPWTFRIKQHTNAQLYYLEEQGTK